jgi:hypothetical protein
VSELTEFAHEFVTATFGADAAGAIDCTILDPPAKHIGAGNNR